MIVLSCNNLNKSFGIDTVLENISFTVNEGDKVGIIGVNGTGKTTLFKVLSGIYGYDSGDIYLGKGVEIGYLEQNTNFQSDKTIYEEVLEVFSDLMEMEKYIRNLEIKISEESSNPQSKELDKLMNEYSHKLELFSELNGYGYKSEVKGILKGLGFSDEDMQTPINILSGGEKTRVLLSKLLLKNPSLLLLDEPTNHLDSDAIEWLEVFLKQYKGTVIIISHDRYFLDQVVNRVFEIHNKRLKTYNGNYSKFIELSKVEKELEVKKYEDQQKEIKKQEESIERLKAYGREKHLKRARSKEKMLDKVDVLDKPDVFRKKASIQFNPAVSSGNDVLEVKDLSMGYGERILFKDINFNIYRGEKVALIGANGIGKSTLFKIIMNEIVPLTGNTKLGTNVHVDYFHQEQKTLNLDNTIIDEIWNDHPNLNQTTLRNMLGSFLFEDEEVFKKISTLSGGERARVAILKLILSNSNFLLLDEPTNHLDIDSKEVLEEALLNYTGTLFTISHDRYFLNTVVDKILVLDSEGITEYLGNYNYYMEKKKQALEMNTVETVEEKTKTQLKDEKRKEREQREIEKKARVRRQSIEKEIEEIEAKIEELDLLMCQEDVYSNPEKSKEVSQNKSNLEENLNNLYEEWEQLM
ncbi:ABC-F family ATP-binding cassette domain-containing protein [Paraclostridium sordellii]|uniref:ABC-F family ATP-binding cassette domain-containing protein n=1 Tax=Paraclostridium sordellii TaxID=1505 RepID=UPI0005E07AAF|nr:ABC-F family ATP-binding cassette domain-containing protein [Paeniclostridium sordellii]MCQ4698475.1 ATP-binding cassette domain-containing protein [Paeniclostridium sordellii]MDU4414680.1 ABC-F family ATP-binding cassette domain-containing protein [Paeniclostridium sordellii]MDU6482436.1 ABC-F family ATP-binding cassette domain-containing protein [Paeniclostridium sordellii]MRZ27315.1 ATP-binding cassette domain-containing protein [Paeniclostridium sordellii]MVO73573.1 ATP-binding cassette